MIFAELKNIQGLFTLKVVASVLCNIVPHDLARKIILSLPVRNSQTVPFVHNLLQFNGVFTKEREEKNSHKDNL